MKRVHDDLLTNHGEWLSMAMERQGDTLITYLDPEGLVWNGAKYVQERSFTFSKKEEFDITGKASHTFIDLKLFDEQLVRYVYGRAFADLPSEMKEGDRRAQLHLQAEGMVRPVGRGGFGSGFVIGNFFDSWASRGVASVGAKK